MRKGKRLTLEDRMCIEEMLKNGHTPYRISILLNYSNTAIYEEIKKNGGEVFYNAQNAQIRADKLIARNPSKLTEELIKKFRSMLPENNKEVSKFRNFLTFEERKVIELMKKEGFGSLNISIVLNRGVRTISNEFGRYFQISKEKEYIAEKAESISKENNSNKPNFRVKLLASSTKELKNEIENLRNEINSIKEIINILAENERN